MCDTDRHFAGTCDSSLQGVFANCSALKFPFFVEKGILRESSASELVLHSVNRKNGATGNGRGLVWLYCSPSVGRERVSFQSLVRTSPGILPANVEERCRPLYLCVQYI